MPAPIRYSPKREAVYEAVRAVKTHPSAEWVFQNVRSKYPDISLGTVYRNLSQLKDDGRLIMVGVVDGRERFDATVETHPHFVCERCDGVFDLDIPDYGFLDFEVEETSGFTVKSHEIVFHGLCDKCKTKKSDTYRRIIK